MSAKILSDAVIRLLPPKQQVLYAAQIQETIELHVLALEGKIEAQAFAQAKGIVSDIFKELKTIAK